MSWAGWHMSHHFEAGQWLPSLQGYKDGHERRFSHWRHFKPLLSWASQMNAVRATSQNERQPYATFLHWHRANSLKAHWGFIEGQASASWIAGWPSAESQHAITKDYFTHWNFSHTSQLASQHSWHQGRRRLKANSQPSLQGRHWPHNRIPFQFPEGKGPHWPAESQGRPMEYWHNNNRAFHDEIPASQEGLAENKYWRSFQEE